MLMFLLHIWTTDSRPNTDYYIDSHFSCESKTLALISAEKHHYLMFYQLVARSQAGQTNSNSAPLHRLK